MNKNPCSTSQQDGVVPPAPSQVQVLTVREYCQKFRVSKSTVLRLVEAGELPVRRIGRSIRILDTLL